MGNSYQFGLTRDKNLKRFPVSKRCAGSLSLDKYDVLYEEFLAFESTVEPNSKSDLTKSSQNEISFKNPIILKFCEIENYCKETKNSKGWENERYGNYPRIETIRGSVWSDDVPVIRIKDTVEKDITIEQIADCVLSPEIRKKWDPFMTNITQFKHDDLFLMEYEIKLPVKWKRFRDYVKVKRENNELCVISYSTSDAREGDACNLFTYVKINKRDREICLNFLSQIDYCIGKGKRLPELSGKLMGLSFKALIGYLCEL